MSFFNKKFTIPVLVAIILAQFYPALVLVSNAQEVLQPKEASDNQLPPFPEDLARKPFNWASVNWDGEVVLESDKIEYNRKLQTLAENGQADEALNLILPSRKFSDPEVMEYYKAPLPVRYLVNQYKEKTAKADENQIILEQEILKQKIIKAGYGQEVAINSPKAKKSFAPLSLGPLSFTPESEPTEEDEIIDINAKESISLNSAKSINILSGQDIFVTSTSTAFASQAISSKSFAPLAPQSGAIIEYYDGIEENPVDNILYYFSLRQNEDASFGSYNKYQLTARLADRLKSLKKTSNTQYQGAVDYVLNNEPKNNRDKAWRAKILLNNNTDASEILEQIALSQNSDGGFGIKNGYGSDILTTLEAIDAFTKANYSSQDKLPQALYYILQNIDTQKGLSYFGEQSSYYLINKALQVLYPYKQSIVSNQNGDFVVSEKIDELFYVITQNYDEELSSFTNSSDTIDILTSLGSLNLYNREPEIRQNMFAQAKYLQNPNGGFSNSTEAALAGLGALTQPNLRVVDIEDNTSLINQDPSSWTVVVVNDGNAVAVPADLFIFVDKALFKKINLQQIGINSIAPGQTAYISFSIDNTYAFVGDVGITTYVELEQEDFNYQDNWLSSVFNFRTALDGSPGLPVYYIAQKYDINSLPAINVRWQVKEDSARSEYAFLFREVGTQQWFFVRVPDNVNGGFISPFEEDKQYEATIGVFGLDNLLSSYISETTIITTSSDPDKYMGSAQGLVTVDNKPQAGVNFFAYGFGPENSTAADIFDFSGKVGHGSNAAWVDEEYYESYVSTFNVETNATSSPVRILTSLKQDFQAPQINIFEVTNESDYQIKNQQEVTVIVGNSDNIAVKEADFYYFDPKEEVWIFAGTFTNNATPIFFKWYIPAGLSGNGYKIRALVRDYQGNESEFLEWGPFEVIDGTLPSGVITIENLNNNSWSLGEEKKIVFDIQSPNQIFSVNQISIYTPTTSRQILSDLNPQENSFDYTIPLNGNFASQQAYIRAEVCDVNLNCQFLQSEDFAIIDESPNPNYPWAEEKVFQGMDTAINLNWQRYLQSAFEDSQGNREIVYREKELYFDGTPSYNRLVYRKFTNNAWQEPLIIKENQYIFGQTVDIDFYEVLAKKDSSGKIHIVYSQSLNNNFDSVDLYYTQIANGNVLVNRSLSQPDDTNSIIRDMVIDNLGNVYVVWAEGFSLTGGANGFYKIHYIQGDGLNNWNEIIELSQDSSSRVSLSLNGNSPIVAYVAKNQIYLRKKINQTWQEPFVLSNSRIEKNKLNSFADDVSKLDLIVFVVEGDEQYFYWNNQIKTVADLDNILNQNNFVNKNEIKQAYLDNDYGYQARDLKLSLEENGVYELFYLYSSAQTNWKSQINHIKFNVNFTNQEIGVLADGLLIDKEPESNVLFYRVIPKEAGGHHIFYLQQENKIGDSNTTNLPYYSFYNGDKVYFTTVLSSLLRFIDSSVKVASASGNKVTMYFGNLYNIADYSDVSDYKLDYVAPKNKTDAPGPTVALEWSLDGGVVTSYSVRLGASPHILETVASGIPVNSYNLTGLEMGKLYYWQVLAHYNDKIIYGNVNQFIPYQSSYSISGTIKYYDAQKAIPSANVILENEQGQIIDSTQTDELGGYILTGISPGEPYYLKAQKQDSRVDVSVSDIVKTVRHILAKDVFDTIYKVAAADIDGDGVVLIPDVLKMVNYILRKEDIVGGGWKFYDKDFVLDEANYLTSGQSRFYSEINSDLFDQDFVGLKLGDVNNSWRN